MKKAFLFAAVAAVALVACSKEYHDAPVFAGATDALYIYPGMNYSLPLSGGGGNYKVELLGGGGLTADFADVSIDRTGGLALAVKTHEGKSGSANIVVTDTESGKTANCFLCVNTGNYTSGWGVDEQRHTVDAGAYADRIDADLRGKLFPTGTTLSFDPHMEHDGRFGAGHWAVWKIVNGATDTLARGTFRSMPLDLNNIPAAYDDLPIEQDIHSATRYVFQQQDGEHVYDLFFVHSRESRGSLDRMMYEDRTEYYRARYPNPDVKSVVNRYVQRFHE